MGCKSGSKGSNGSGVKWIADIMVRGYPPLYADVIKGTPLWGAKQKWMGVFFVNRGVFFCNFHEVVEHCQRQSYSLVWKRSRQYLIDFDFIAFCISKRVIISVYL